MKRMEVLVSDDCGIENYEASLTTKHKSQPKNSYDCT
jgi:hypothetical protein